MVYLSQNLLLWFYLKLIFLIKKALLPKAYILYTGKPTDHGWQFLYCIIGKSKVDCCFMLGLSSWRSHSLVFFWEWGCAILLVVHEYKLSITITRNNLFIRKHLHTWRKLYSSSSSVHAQTITPSVGLMITSSISSSSSSCFASHTERWIDENKYLQIGNYERNYPHPDFADKGPPYCLDSKGRLLQYQCNWDLQHYMNQKKRF